MDCLLSVFLEVNLPFRNLAAFTGHPRAEYTAMHSYWNLKFVSG